MKLAYRHNACVSDLAVGECTVHRAGDASGARWWILWFRGNRDDDGRPDDFCVPINPHGSYLENGPGGRTWGFNAIDIDGVAWMVSPSINVLASRAVHPGEHAEVSIWHYTPEVVGVPREGVAWVEEAP